MKYTIIFIILFLCGTTAIQAQVPVPANEQENPILLVGATAHIGNGNVIQNAAIGFANGKITVVGSATNIGINVSNYTRIDVSGQHIYPGFILPNTPLGLQEVSSVRAMSDQNEQGSINPNVRAVVAYNTDSELIPTMRFNGILLAESTPSGGLISGCSALMEMEGWNWEDAAHTPDVAMHLNWPNKMRRNFDFATFSVTESPNEDYAKQVDDLTRHFKDAYAYGRSSSNPSNLKMDRMQGLFDGSITLMIHTNEPKEIIEAVNFAEKNKVERVALVAGSGALPIAQFLVDRNIPVILTAVHSLPARADFDIDLPYKLPHLMTQAGLQVSLSHSGMLSNARNLPFYAGTAVAYGMEKEEALMTITLNPAKALGVDDRVGSLETGKDASLIISTGDVFDIRHSILSHAFISGKEVILDNKQQALFRRYSKKYGHME